MLLKKLSAKLFCQTQIKFAILKNLHLENLARNGIIAARVDARGVTNTQGGEYDTYHEYKAMNTTIYS